MTNPTTNTAIPVILSPALAAMAEESGLTADLANELDSRYILAGPDADVDAFMEAWHLKPAPRQTDADKLWALYMAETTEAERNAENALEGRVS